MLLVVMVLVGIARPAGAQEGGPSSGLRFPHDSPRLSSDAAVKEWVGASLHKRLGLKPSDSLEVAGPRRRIRDWVAFRVVQTVNGIAVVNQESRLLLDSQRRPALLLGRHTAFPSPPSETPTLNLTEALALAGTSSDAVWDSRLVYWPTSDAVTLSYEIEGVFGDDVDHAERIYVDARTGELLDRSSLIHRSVVRRVYDFESACMSAGIRNPMGAFNSTRLLGISMRRHLKREEGSDPSGLIQVDQVFDLLGRLHEFLASVLEMDSFDDGGAPMRSVVNVRFHRSKAYLPQCVGDAFNAAWSDRSRVAILPIGISRYPEILGHEFGHAIISSGSRLIYKRESGALNEAISDSIGAGFRAWIEGGGHLDSKIPDEIWNMRDASGVMRNFQNPRRVNNLPNHYSDYRRVRGDHAGVHINSSIINQGFYLLAVGGRHPDIRLGPEVQGVGIAKALKVFGRAGFNLLTPNADFRDARYAFALAAEILFGANSKEWAATHTAMDAIGIPGTWDRPPERVVVPEPPVSTGGGESFDPSSEVLPQPEQKVPGNPTPSEDARERSEDIDRLKQDREERVAVPTQSEEPLPVPSPSLPAPSTQTTVPKIPSHPVPPTPLPPPLPTDSQPEPSLPNPTEVLTDSPRVGVLVSGAIVLLLLAVALMFVRFGMSGNTRDESPNPNPASITPQESIGAGSIVWGSLCTLDPLDGSALIPFNRDLLVSSEGLVIGRALELCHIEIRDPSVSRRHVRCRLVRGDFWIEDLYSTAGTAVDGVAAEPFMPAKVFPGQILRIGDHSYRIAPVEDETSA